MAAADRPRDGASARSWRRGRGRSKMRSRCAPHGGGWCGSTGAATPTCGDYHPPHVDRHDLSGGGPSRTATRDGDEEVDSAALRARRWSARSSAASTRSASPRLWARPRHRHDLRQPRPAASSPTTNPRPQRARDPLEPQVPDPHPPIQVNPRGEPGDNPRDVPVTPTAR